MHVGQHVDIHFCAENEIDAVMEFLGRYWSKDHVLSTSRALMDWQHYNEAEGRYNIVIARSGERGEVLGMLGYIPTKHYDSSLTKENTIWLTTWKARDDAGVAGVGLMLHSFLVKNEDYRLIGTVGNNKKVAMIYKAMRYDVGTINQYYILNESREEYHLAGGPRSGVTQDRKFSKQSKEFREITKQNFDEFSRELTYVQPKTRVPRKSLGYFRARFLEHPVYVYKLYAVMKGHSPQGLLALRCAEAAEGRALRIVDYFGPDEGFLGTAGPFNQLMDRYEAEYVDMYNLGLDESALLESGFSKLDPGGDFIVPSHFEPFEKKNVVINYSYKPDQKSEYMIFKGDCDQDRPSRIGGAGLGRVNTQS